MSPAQGKHTMNTIRITSFWACLATVVFKLGPVMGTEISSGDNSEMAAVRAAGRNYLAALRRHDTEELLRSWTVNGDYIDAAGRKAKAREWFGRNVAAPRPAQTTENNIQTVQSEIRFITPTVAIEDGAYDGGDAPDGTEVTGRFTAVWVKQDGRWLLDSLRESTTTTPSRSENLKPLEWLVGEWVGISDDSEILVSSRWSDTGNYIIRELAVIGDDSQATGTERIGWDPSAREFKSWTFDSQDGRGEGRWKRDGDNWVVDIKEVTADGKEATTSAIVTPVGSDQYVWEVRSSKVGDQNLAPRRIEFTRAPDSE
jgi:uncharacterized protein (TIGR02246 family)